MEAITATDVEFYSLGFPRVALIRVPLAQGLISTMSRISAITSPLNAGFRHPKSPGVYVQLPNNYGVKTHLMVNFRIRSFERRSQDKDVEKQSPKMMCLDVLSVICRLISGLLSLASGRMHRAGCAACWSVFHFRADRSLAVF